MKMLAGVVEYVFDSTRALASLVYSGMRRRYPRFRYIATHGGGTLPYVAERIAFMASVASRYDTRLNHEEVMHDLKGIHYDLALSTSKPTLVALREFLPIEQIVIGFDFPFAPPQSVGPAIASVLNSEIFRNDELGLIASRNALPLLPGFAERQPIPSLR
jgi:6-methylsalicylate decarboxylase